jgi:hypothetical protein
MSAADINRLTADHTNSTTTKTAVSDLDVVLLANTVYAFEFVLRTSANAATVGIQHALRFSGTVTRLDAALEYWSAATTKASLVITAAASSPQNFNPTASQGNVVQVEVIRGIIEVGASGGTLGIDHGSETASLTTVHRGSYVVVSPV